MPTIANMPAADIQVTFPNGKVKNVNMIRLLVHTQNAEFKAAHGMFLPGVGKQHPTLKALRAEYELPVRFSRTWSQAGEMLRDLHTQLTEAIKAAS